MASPFGVRSILTVELNCCNIDQPDTSADSPVSISR